MTGYAAEFARLAVAHLLAAASPGPDFAIVLRQSLRRGRREGIWTALGIGTGNAVHVTYSLFGLGLLFQRAPHIFIAIKWLGAAYLAWLGVQCLRCAGQGYSPVEAASVSAAATPGDHPFRVGLFTNLLNPKCTLFFVAFFATLVSPATPAPIRIGYGIWTCLATIAWFYAVATAFTQPAVRRTFLRLGPWIDRALGVAFIGFAVLLATAKLSRG